MDEKFIGYVIDDRLKDLVHAIRLKSFMETVVALAKIHPYADRTLSEIAELLEKEVINKCHI